MITGLLYAVGVDHHQPQRMRHMNQRFSRLALNLVLAGTLSAALLGCGKEENITPVVEDSVLTSNVKAAIAADPELKGLDIQVAANAGVVELSGAFDSYPKLDRALSVVRGVTGVKSVDDKTIKREEAAAAPATAAAPAPQ
ncbi:MAG: BON domain-containing protein [Rhodocyclaceae bacterium]|nr:BON domain-containing protein [Rhodocyclaceae bacterium]